jgi:hypothetical protein
MKTELILVRTNYYDATLDTFVRYLMSESGRRVALALDDSQDSVFCPSDITVIRARPEKFNLPNLEHFMWRCGDYVLYEALLSFPEIENFWLIEADARIHTPNLLEFFDGSESTTRSDFVTAWFIPGVPEWFWYDRIKDFVPNVFNCMLQICRISSGAVKCLLEHRQKLSFEFYAGALDLQRWPNDESFVASILKQENFQISLFCDHAPRYMTKDTFTFIKPTSLRKLHQKSPDRTIYHPVVEGELFLKRSIGYLDALVTEGAGYARLTEEFGIEFFHQLRLEGGPSYVAQFRDLLERHLLNW